MALENLFERLLDKSAAMRALRKSAGKAVVLGMLDALQAPGARRGVTPLSPAATPASSDTCR